jgi:O-antigen ligase
MAERNPKIAVYRVLNVIRRCAIFHVALGFAQLLPSQFARIPGQRFQPSAKGTMDRSFHRRVTFWTAGLGPCFHPGRHHRGSGPRQGKI